MWYTHLIFVIFCTGFLGKIKSISNFSLCFVSGELKLRNFPITWCDRNKMNEAIIVTVKTELRSKHIMCLFEKNLLSILKIPRYRNPSPSFERSLSGCDFIHSSTYNLGTCTKIFPNLHCSPVWPIRFIKSLHAVLKMADTLETCSKYLILEIRVC